MATDFGDESGEKLFDWMLRVGQEAGQEALAKSAKGLAEAIRSTCAGIEKSEGSGGAAAICPSSPAAPAASLPGTPPRPWPT